MMRKQAHKKSVQNKLTATDGKQPGCEKLAGRGAASLPVYSPDLPGARPTGDQRANVPPAAVNGTAHSRGGYAARKDTHVCKCPSVHTN